MTRQPHLTRNNHHTQYAIDAENPSITKGSANSKMLIVTIVSLKDTQETNFCKRQIDFLYGNMDESVITTSVYVEHGYQTRVENRLLG